MDRPTLLPHLRPLWRDRTTLQLGTDPDRALVVEFARPVATRILGLLDGTRTDRGVLDDARLLGIPAEQVTAVVAALRGAGALIGAGTLLPTALPHAQRRRLAAEAAALATCRSAGSRTPAQVLRRRADAQVLVAGQPRLVAPIAAALAAAGVGHVAALVPGEACTADDVAVGGITAADVGRPAAEAVARVVSSAAPDAEVGPLRPEEATFIVRVGFDPTPAELAARAYARRRLPHLAVAVRDGVIVVGPFVPPGGTPCLSCLDLHRTDRDPAWRRLAAQLATDPPPSQACAATTVLLGVGYAASEVLSYLDGGSPRTRGGCVEIDAAGNSRRRSWSSHPRCDCRRTRRSVAGRSELI
jgi:bacteriocin biosynthesis cyclodehydratase domain-containing protein